jgi:nicotinamide-nucleotide amidase
MADQLRASIVVIGDEILAGYVRDTNSGWLARRLHDLGIPLDRVVTVPDDIDAIGEAITAELARRRPRVLLTSGGIGSTPDDLTLEAVAASLGEGLRVETQIEARIDSAVERAGTAGVHLTDEHRRTLQKMALVPEHGYLLAGAEGMAPGVAVDVDGGVAAPEGATIVVLPGIPSELQRLVTEAVEPSLLSGRGQPQHVVELKHGYPESSLGPLLDRLVAEFPDVRTGSYPARECLIRLRGPTDRVEEAARLVRDYLEGLDQQPGSEQLRASWAARWTD